MPDAIDLGAISMTNDIRMMEAVSHNVANANMPAFKRDRVALESFETLLTTELKGIQPAVNPPEVRKSVDFSQGSLRHTDRALDLAIEGEGFFEVATPSGPALTRHGAFQLDGMGRLVNVDGHTIMGYGGEIRLSSDAPQIDSLGKIWEGDSVVAQLKMVNAVELSQLEKVGEQLYSLSGLSVEIAPEEMRVRQGFLENANVVALDEMLLMIKTARHLEMTQRVMRGYDDIISQAITSIADF